MLENNTYTEEIILISYITIRKDNVRKYTAIGKLIKILFGVTLSKIHAPSFGVYEGCGVKPSVH